MGLPPDRAPRDEDWAWLNALAGHPEPGTEKRVLRETQLLAEALKAAMGGREPPLDETRMGLLADDPSDRFMESSSLSAQDFEEFSSKDVMASYEPLFSSEERIRSSAIFSRATSDDDGLYPEPTGNGFARLKRRLQNAGLL